MAERRPPGPARSNPALARPSPSRTPHDQPTHPERELPRLELLCLDPAFAVVNKPPGLPSDHTPDPARPTVLSELARQLAQAGETAELFSVHRLDRDTSGVLLVARTRDAASHFAAAFADHTARKIYRALCLALVKPPAEPWTVDNHLGPLPRARSRDPERFGAVRSGGKRAISRFRVVEARGDLAELEAAPETGRTHQLRIHLADAGFPILGDPLYAPERAQRLAPFTQLHALELHVPLPDGSTRTFVAPWRWRSR